MNNTISVTGHLCLDYILTVDEYPPIGESRRVADRKIYFGGGAANIAVGIAKLGGCSELISAVGTDFSRTGYEEHLKNLGVKTHLYRSSENCSTAFMVNNKEGDQITYFEWGAGEAFSHAVPPQRDFIHMATGDADYNIKVSESAKFASLDPGQDVKYYTKEQLKELLDLIDMLICNNFEMNIMCSTLNTSEKDIIEKVPISIITEGRKGSTLYYKDDVIKIPSVNVNAVDPTGAGDSYRAGLFTAYKKGYSLETSCKVGAVVSSFDVEAVGTQTNLPNWEQMKERYELNFGELK